MCDTWLIPWPFCFYVSYHGTEWLNSVHYILEPRFVYVTYVQYMLDSKSYRYTITAYSVTNQRYFYSTQGRRTAAPLRGAGINVRIVVYCKSTLSRFRRYTVAGRVWRRGSIQGNN
jgi:hypothetical protein